MINFESMYAQLPVGLQHAACSVEGWRIERRRFGPGFREIHGDVVARGRLSSDVVAGLRDSRLRTFVTHGVQTVPFYRRRFGELGLRPEDVNDLDELKHLPVLTKPEVQDAGEAMASELVTKDCLTTHTSGTTGGGLRFKTTLSAIQEQWAVWWRYRSWHGLQPGEWCAHLGGRSVVPPAQHRPPFWRYNYPGRQILFSAYHLTPEAVPLYLAELRRQAPLWIHGYPSIVALLAGHILERGEDLGFRVKWLTVGAENLLPQQRALIERAFGVKPRQHYGMAEAVANFSECELGVLHVDEDFAAVEFLPDPDGQGLRVVGTNFSNPATPLIRYDTGDRVAGVTDGPCPCGRPGRLVEGVDGRLEDYVVLRNGARIGRMDHVFKDLVQIREAQIYQRERGVLLVRVVRGDGYRDGDELRLREEFRRRVGDQAEIMIEYTERLERSSAGKLRFVISEIAQIGRGT
jgi:phenylacetate-CoA ligase